MTDNEQLRFAIVASTSGSVMDNVLHDPFLRERVQLVVVDRQCAALEKARAHGVESVLLDRPSVEAFCDDLLARFRHERIDYVLSYYTDFYSERFRRAYANRIINFHPSVLPAFKGIDGFAAAVAYPARLTGNTVELIENVMDEGKIVMQTVCPIDLNQPIEATRHRVFVQQCKALLQVVRWLQDGRISVSGRTVSVRGAAFDDIEYSPAIDSSEVVAWTVPEYRATSQVS